MPGRQVREGLGNLGKKFDRMILDGVSKASHLRPQFRGDRVCGQLLEGVDERVSEAVQSVSMLDDAFALDVVQNFAHLFGSEPMMIQERNKPADGALEVDVVLPERVVGVDEESLSAIGCGIERRSWHQSGCQPGTPGNELTNLGKRPSLAGHGFIRPNPRWLPGR